MGEAKGFYRTLYNDWALASSEEALWYLVGDLNSIDYLDIEGAIEGNGWSVREDCKEYRFPLTILFNTDNLEELL